MSDKARSLTRLIRRLDLRLQHLEAACSRLVTWRLLVFGLSLVFILLSLFHPSFRPLWYSLTVVSLGLFIWLVIRHNRLKKQLVRWQLWRRIKQTNLARIQLNWDRLPTRAYPVPAEHPYAKDLDIFGSHSLLQLLDTTISSRGTRVLMDWLLYPEADLQRLRQRQQLVQELRPRSLFRDKLTLEASCISDREINGETILARLQPSPSAWISRIRPWEIGFWLAAGLFYGSWLTVSSPAILWGIAYVGLNLCLAQAGGFVCASSFRSSWFQIHGCLRISDSVTEGLSYFYAEVKRLKSILEAARNAEESPLLVLIDEIFKGTNNRERIIGSTHYLHGLTRYNLLGLISTHDLEITGICSQDKGKILNFHFQEAVENGQMKFDFRLRPGVCPTTNALKIMASEGLPVPVNAAESI